MSNFPAFPTHCKMLEYMDDSTYRGIGGLPCRPSYCTAVWLSSGYYTLRRDGTVHHSYAYGQQERTYTFSSPALALWGSVGLATYVLTLHGVQYICTTYSPPQLTQQWDRHYFYST
jgi:hypothetical protein